MKRSYLVLGWSVVVLGLLHTIATAWIFPALTNGAVWFLSGGLAIGFAGLLNLLSCRYGAAAMELRRICVAVNLTMCGFVVLVETVAGAPRMQIAVILGIFIALTALSLLTRDAVMPQISSSDREPAGFSRILDDVHRRARNVPWLYWFATMNRVALAVGFTPSGLTKVVGNRFTTLSPATPIGGFFEAMYQTGVYWNFIGWCQLAAALLLVLPRTATIGAVLYFPIILNIFAITLSLHFTGTPLITGAMLLSNIFLLCWDYDKLKALWTPARVTV